MGDIVIYDTETSDADVRHGQILQFGGIRADETLNLIEDLNIRVRRSPWVVPSPEAMQVTGISPQDLEEGDSEYSASRKIESFLVPGYGQSRIFITFNGIRFDDEIIRTTQFRNLRNPWVTSGRLSTKVDLLPISQLVSAVTPSALNVPIGEEGRKSFKLENLSKANGIENKSHDALGDAYSTFELAKLIKERAPWAWETALRCGLPQRTETLLADAFKEGKPLLLFTHFGEPDVIPCAILGTDDRKKWILFDLRTEVTPESTNEIRDQMYQKGSSFPIIRSNASPIFLDGKTARTINPNLDFKSLIQKSMKIKNSNLRTAGLDALLSSEYSQPTSPTSEELIYGQFVSDRDKPKMTAFHRADTWEKRLNVTFEDRRLADFASRILLEAHLSGEICFDSDIVEQLRDECQKALQRPYAEVEARWMTFRKAMETADDVWRPWYMKEFEQTFMDNVDVENYDNVRNESLQTQMRF